MENLINTDALLYSKSVLGIILYWGIDIQDGYLNTYSGILGGNITVRPIHTKRKLKLESETRYRKKLNQGYRQLSYYDIRYTEDTNSLIKQLQLAIPDTLLDDKEVFKSMLCQKFKEGKVQYPAIAQPKINGLRSTNRKEFKVEGSGMFAMSGDTFTFRSREGNVFVIPHLTGTFKHVEDNCDYGLNFDGELYIPMYPLNVINSAVPYVNKYGTLSKHNHNTLKLQHWLFDLAIPDLSQIQRLDKLDQWAKDCKSPNIIKLSSDPIIAMATAKVRFNLQLPTVFVLGYVIINSDEEALEYKERCLYAGFEGCVIRDMYAEYAFGKRPKTMMKLKKFRHTECLILDIIGEGAIGDIGPRADTIKFVLKNDINDGTFECTPKADHATRAYLYDNKELYIGKLATVVYGERSGVKKVPFHANVEAWDREAIGDININDLNKE